MPYVFQTPCMYHETLIIHQISNCLFLHQVHCYELYFANCLMKAWLPVIKKIQQKLSFGSLPFHAYPYVTISPAFLSFSSLPSLPWFVKSLIFFLLFYSSTLPLPSSTLPSTQKKISLKLLNKYVYIHKHLFIFSSEN